MDVLHCRKDLLLSDTVHKFFLYNGSFFPISFLNQNYVGLTITVSWNLCYHKRQKGSRGFQSVSEKKKPSLRKHCHYYSKAAKLEFQVVLLKAWHSSLKSEIHLCYFNKIVPF